MPASLTRAATLGAAHCLSGVPRVRAVVRLRSRLLDLAHLLARWRAVALTPGAVPIGTPPLRKGVIPPASAGTLRLRRERLP